LAAALALFIPLLYLTLFLDGATFTWLIREEHPIELGGALSLLLAGIACFVLWRRVRGDADWPPLRRLSLIVLCAFFVFGFGEEVSWGQRVLGLETPESVAEVNRQQELNLHNIGALGGVNTLFQVFWVLMGVVIPLLALWRPARVRLERLVPILPAVLAPLFVLNQILTRGFAELLQREPDLYHSTAFPPAHGIVEIKETLVAVLLAAGFWLLVYGARSRTP
jgi:hypothetical protein